MGQIRGYIDGVEVITHEDVTVSGDLTVGDKIVLTGGGSIESTDNGDIQLLPNGTGINKVGDAGSTSRSLSANDDLFVSGKLEVDGVFYADGGIESASNTFTS